MDDTEFRVINTSSIVQSSLYLEKSYNEAEKSKGLLSKWYPNPREIKQSLGECIGKRIVELIPRDIFRQFKFDHIDRIPPTDVEVTMKNVLSNNIKLTTTDIADDTEINLYRVKTIGNYCFWEVYNKYEDNYYNERYAQLLKWVEEKKEENVENNLQIIPMAKQKYKIESRAILEEYNCKYMKTLASMERFVMEECEMSNEVVETIEQDIKNINKYVHDSVKLKEKTSRNEFNFSMELVQGELYEEFLEEKCENQNRWNNTIYTLDENNCRMLKYLKASSEAELNQDLTDLELWYEGKKQEIMARVDNNIQMEVVDEEDDEIDTTEISEIDYALSDRNIQLLVYTKRLKYLLNSYTDFILNHLQRRPLSLQKQLTQAKLLMKRVNEIKTSLKGYKNEYRSKRCAKNKRSNRKERQRSSSARVKP